jgi:hypothetical protein
MSTIIFSTATGACATISGMSEAPLGLVLFLYAVASFSYSSLCGVLGRGVHPLGAYQVYAVACAVWFLVGCVVFRPKRLWPPTKTESLAAVGSVIILTSETLALLSPASLLAVIAGKAGCLLIPDKDDRRPLLLRYGLAGLTFIAILLASQGKPLRTSLLPLGLAVLYFFGHRLVLHSVRQAKGGTNSEKHTFLAAKQVVVAGLVLIVSAAFSHAAPSAPLSDWRLWLLGLASLSAGVLGTRLVLRSERQGVVFPAYRATSLLCALGAGYMRGEHVSAAAVALAVLVVLLACTDPKAIARKLALAVLLVVWPVEPSATVTK